MRSMFVAALALTLAACTGRDNGTEAADANVAVGADMMSNADEGVDQLMNVQGHEVNDAAARNMLDEDASANHADAILGNGT